MREVELVSKRKPKEKHFLREDGTIVARIYNQNVHYQENGKYQEIDNTLTKKNGYYSNKQNEYKVYYKNQSIDEFFKMEKDKYYLNIKLKDEKEVKSRKKKKQSKYIEDISYTNILDGINIEYKTLPTKVKETIVLKNKNSVKNKLVFFVNTNLELELEKNEILLKDKNKIIFTIEKPYMMDKNGVINHNIRYFIERNEVGYEIELDLDMEWLMDKNTKYPVRVDPTITNYSKKDSVQDTYIYEGDSNVDRNSHTILKAGVDRFNGIDKTNRTLLKFELPEIGTGSEIIDANLNLIGYPIGYGSEGTEQTVTIHQITTPWDEVTANWDNMHDKYMSRVESILFARRSVSIGEQIEIPAYCSAYLTTLVKKWYTGTPNYGIMLKAAEEVYIDDGYPAFFSKSAAREDFEVKPTLEITYRNQNGLESYLDYKSQEFAQGTTYVNSYNGNLTGIWTLGSTIGGKLPASVGLVYNTNDVVLNKNTIYGRGYKLTLDQTIKETGIDDYNYLEYVDEDGTIHYFNEMKTEEETSYKDEDGLNLTVKKEENKYVMTDKNGNTMIYNILNGVGYLEKMTDVSENSIQIERNSSNQITKIIDANEQEINIIYETNKIKVVSPEDTVELTYNNKDLVGFKDRQGTSTIIYNTNHLITDIVDITGMKINYIYYSERPYKVQKVTQYGLNNEQGNYFTLDYGFETTTMKDHKGRINTLIFNSLGNLLSSNSMTENEDLNKAYSTVNEYGDENYHKNKLLADTIPVKYIKNYIENSSFEEEEDLFDSEYTYYNIQKSHSADDAVSGYKSCKIIVEEGKRYLYSREIQLLKNGYYTFSGYFKNNKKVKLSVIRYDKERNLVQNSIEIEPSDQFLRHDITFYNEDDYYGTVTISMYFEDKCTVYIDDVQLEEGEVANDYNILDNSDFSKGLSGWVLESSKTDYTTKNENGMPSIVQVPTNETFEVVKVNNNQNTALKIKMNPLGRSSLERRFPIKGKKGDIYTVSFWYKNEGVESDGNRIGNSVMIYFKPVGEDLDHCVLPSKEFNSNENKWQYFTFRYDAEKDYEEIRLLFNQGGNANTLYITNISFYKDIASSFYEYDEEGNVTNIKDSSKDESNIFGYDKNNQLISATTPKGKHFKYEYDNEKTDHVLSAISSMGISNKVEYDHFGNPIKTKISKKENEKFENGLYLIRNKGTSKYINVKNKNIKLEHDSCSNTIWKVEKFIEETKKTVTKESGEQEEIVEQQENIKIIYPLMPEYSLKISQNQGAQLHKNTDSLISGELNTFILEKNKNGSYYIRDDKKEISTMKYNGLCAKPKQISDQDEIITISEMSYQNIDRSDPSFEFYFEIPEEKFIETTATYTDDGRFVTSVTDSNFNTTNYTTDPLTGLTTSMTNANNQTTSYTYNDKKQITSVTQGEKSVNYTYNDKNLLEKITQGNKEYKFTYDNFLNSKTVQIGNNIILVNNEYEPNNGNLTKTTYGNNHEITFEYDEFDRAKIIHKMDKDYHYKYDSNGNLAKVLEFNPIATYDTDPTELENPYDSITKYDYDSAKRIEEYRKDDFGINYGYDKNDNVTSKKYRLNETVHEMKNTYDKDDQLTSTETDNEKVDYNYDSLGRLSNKTINNSYNTIYDYISRGRRTSELIKSIQNGNNKYSYKYDKLNNITDIYYNNNLKNKYYYDEYNELIKEEDYLKNEKIEYTYDNSGNLLTKITKNLETDAIIKTDTYQYENTNWEDQLTKFNNQLVTYDEIGNPLSIGNDITLDWINGRSLSSYQDTSKNLNINYKYNRDGIRTEKEINGVTTKYYLENSNIIYEQRGNNTIYYLYDLTGLVGLKYNNNTYYYIKNIQGDIIGILDQDYNEIVTYEYDSWGKLLSIKDNQGNEITDETNIGIINPFRYREYYYDTETGLYYLNSRYYNPTWGRFISQDITVGEIGGNCLGHNMYQYAFDNPINLNDSGGVWPKWAKKIIKATAVVAVVAVVSIVTVATAGVGTVAATIALGALKGAVIGTIVGATIGAVGGAIKQRITTESWDGAQEKALNGMGDGALSGAINGAASGFISTTNRVINTAKNWNKGTFNNRTSSLNYHYKKHVIREGGSASNIFEYTDDALNFANQNQNLLRFTNDTKHGNQVWEFRYRGRGGKYEGNGNIITFWYKQK